MILYSSLCSTVSGFRVTEHFMKIPVGQKVIVHLELKVTRKPINVHTYPLRLKLILFHCMISSFRITEHFMKIDQMSLSAPRAKSDQKSYIFTLIPHCAQSIVIFALWWGVCELQKNFLKIGKRSLSAPTIKSGQTLYISTTVPLRAQINLLFALRSTVSELWTVLPKLGQRSLSAPTIESYQTPHTCSTVAPEAQKLPLFYQVLLSYGQFCPSKVKGQWVPQNQK